MVEREAEAYKVEIFVSGDPVLIKHCCQKYVTIGLCVTVTPTEYVYTHGCEQGAIVGLINYARFPEDSKVSIWYTAKDLALRIINELGQGSYTIQDDKRSFWYSHKREH